MKGNKSKKELKKELPANQQQKTKRRKRTKQPANQGDDWELWAEATFGLMGK
jgi:hypothetical protein